MPPRRAARLPYFICPPRLGQLAGAKEKPAACPRTRPHGGGMCGRAAPDSCARLAPYCRLSLVKYDISCGGQFLESVGSVTCWAAGTARPGNDSANWFFAPALEGGLSMSWTDER